MAFLCLMRDRTARVYELFCINEHRCRDCSNLNENFYIIKPDSDLPIFN